MPSLIGRVYAAYRLKTSQELDLGSSELKTPRYLKLRRDFQQLLQHVGDLVPQPAQSNQSGCSSVEQAMAAGHGAAGGACKAPGQAADLARLWSARRGLPRDRRAVRGGASSPVCEKELILVILWEKAERPLQGLPARKPLFARKVQPLFFVRGRL